MFLYTFCYTFPEFFRGTENCTILYPKRTQNVYQYPKRIQNVYKNIYKTEKISYRVNITKQIYYSIGHKKASTPMMLINRFQDLRVSYNCIEFIF